MSSVLRLSLAFLLLLFVLFASASPIVFADTPSSPGVSGSNILPLGKPDDFPGVKFGRVIAPNQTGASGILAFIQFLYETAKQFLGPILVFLMGGMGIRLIIARGSDEDFTGVTNQFLYMIAGMVFIVFAKNMADLFSLYKNGSSFVSSDASIAATGEVFKGYMTIIVKTVRYLLGGISVFYVVRSGTNIIFNAEDETVNKQKEVFIYGFFGFILIMMAESLVNAVFDISTLPGVPQVNVTVGILTLSNFTNLLLAALSGLFLFSLVVGGSMYVFSAGNEERGKTGTTIIIGSLIGLVIAFSSYTLVAEFSSAGGSLEQHEVKTNVMPYGEVLPLGTTPALLGNPPPKSP